MHSQNCGLGGKIPEFSVDFISPLFYDEEEEEEGVKGRRKTLLGSTG